MQTGSSRRCSGSAQSVMVRGARCCSEAAKVVRLSTTPPVKGEWGMATGVSIHSNASKPINTMEATVADHRTANQKENPDWGLG